MNKTSLLFAVLATPAFVSAQPVGFDFLRAPVGARPAAMAASFLSISDDAHSIYYNPAGLATIQTPVATFGYLNHILDIQSFFGAYVRPFSSGNYAFALQYTDYGDFTRTNEFGEELGSFGANNLVATLSFSQVRKQRLLLGANIKFIRSVLEDFSSDAYALDFGVIYKSGLFDNLTFGAGLFNIGGVRTAFDQTKERLPFNFQLGVSKQLAHLPLLYSLTLVRYVEEDFQFRAGGEFTLSTGLFLRLGYNTVGRDQKVGTDRDRFAGLSLGLGLAHRKLTFDYGISSLGEVGSLNRLSVSMVF